MTPPIITCFNIVITFLVYLYSFSCLASCHVPREAGVVHGKLIVTLWYQIYSANQYLMVRGIFLWSFCVRRGCTTSLLSCLKYVLNKCICMYLFHIVSRAGCTPSEDRSRSRGMMSGHWFPPHVLCFVMSQLPCGASPV